MVSFISLLVSDTKVYFSFLVIYFILSWNCFSYYFFVFYNISILTFFCLFFSLSLHSVYFPPFHSIPSPLYFYFLSKKSVASFFLNSYILVFPILFIDFFISFLPSYHSLVISQCFHLFRLKIKVSFFLRLYGISSFLSFIHFSFLPSVFFLPSFHSFFFVFTFLHIRKN